MSKTLEKKGVSSDFVALVVFYQIKPCIDISPPIDMYPLFVCMCRGSPETCSSEQGANPVTLIGRECEPSEAGGPYISLLQFDPKVFNRDTPALGVADAQLKLHLER